jgi:hypothetical protein
MVVLLTFFVHGPIFSCNFADDPIIFFTQTVEQEAMVKAGHVPTRRAGDRVVNQRLRGGTFADDPIFSCNFGG